MRREGWARHLQGGGMENCLTEYRDLASVPEDQTFPADSRNMGKGTLGRGGSGAPTGFHSGHHFGAQRKSGLDGRRCLLRVWVLAVVLTALVTLVSMPPPGFVIQGFHRSPCRVKFLNDQLNRHKFGESRSFLWEHRTKLQTLSVADENLLQSTGSTERVKLHHNPISLARQEISYLMKPKSRGDPQVIEPDLSIQDIVSFPGTLDLFLVKVLRKKEREKEAHAGTVDISGCKYGEHLSDRVNVIRYMPDGRLAVTCTRPPSAEGSLGGLTVKDVSIEVKAGSPIRPGKELTEAYSWDEALVYAVQSTEDDVVLYAKGVFDPRKRKDENIKLDNYRCLFQFEGQSAETAVTAAAQEVFRCGHPKFKLRESPAETPVIIKAQLVCKGTRVFRSVAYYEDISFGLKPAGVGPQLLESVGPADNPHSLGRTSLADEKLNVPEKYSSSLDPASAPKKRYFICSCTMIWNGAKFLREWVHFNSHLGVEKFFLYDNNSEDELESVVSSLGQFNVTTTVWPWVKTQEAGLSHCGMEAQKECTWVLFTDVDEYVFPTRWLQLASPGHTHGPESSPAAPVSPLRSLIEDTLRSGPFLMNAKAAPDRRGFKAGTNDSSLSSEVPITTKVGQITFKCRNFGPSGQNVHPSQGVTQGYTCRDQREQRHKSLVFFPAVKSSLRNVVHHFFLKPEYLTVDLDVRQAVVNHYKYQAWSEFVTKFTKRASTYVVDWREPKNLGSRDRPLGMGSEATKPADWETSHCERKDTALRDYTTRRFGLPGGADDSTKMIWEL